MKKAFPILLFMTSMLHAMVPVKHSELIDESRHRIIPIAIYQKPTLKKQGLVIINHGYTVSNIEYSFIANTLAEKGYYVVSIQHDLKTDPKLPREGNLFQRRMPLWQQGVANILFTLSAIKKAHPGLQSKVILIGHSNGGDITMMFAELHPG